MMSMNALVRTKPSPNPRALFLVGGGLPLLPAAPENVLAGIQLLNELVDQFAQSHWVRFLCDQLAKFSPVFLFCNFHGIRQRKHIAKSEGRRRRYVDLPNRSPRKTFARTLSLRVCGLYEDFARNHRRRRAQPHFVVSELDAVSSGRRSGF
jgi:hypothetical protein